MTIDEFLDIDIGRLLNMTEKDLKAIWRQGANKANKRIKALKDTKNTAAPAFQNLPAQVRKTGTFTSKGKSTSQLRNQIIAQQQFLNARTSTVKGWNKEKERAYEKSTGQKGAKKARLGYDKEGRLITLKPGQKSAMTAKQVNKFWDLFNKAKEIDPAGTSAEGSTDVMHMIYDIIKTNPHAGVSTLEHILADELGVSYEEMQEARQAAIAEATGDSGKVLL